VSNRGVIKEIEFVILKVTLVQTMKACEGNGGTAPHIVRLDPRWSGQFHAPAALIFQKNFCSDSLGGWIGYSRNFQAFASVEPFSRLKFFRKSVPVFQLEMCEKQEKM
jgi:hypothetical protein